MCRQQSLNSRKALGLEMNGGHARFESGQLQTDISTFATASPPTLYLLDTKNSSIAFISENTISEKEYIFLNTIGVCNMNTQL